MNCSGWWQRAGLAVSSLSDNWHSPHKMIKLAENMLTFDSGVYNQIIVLRIVEIRLVSEVTIIY
jgi:hypothetical protein